MVEIVNTIPSGTQLVIVNDGTSRKCYIRISESIWEVLGETWVYLEDPTELESAYQAFKAKRDFDPPLCECKRFDAEMGIGSVLRERGEP